MYDKRFKLCIATPLIRLMRLFNLVDATQEGLFVIDALSLNSQTKTLGQLVLRLLGKRFTVLK